MNRSKAITGHGVITPELTAEDEVLPLVHALRKHGYVAVPEYQEEVILKANNFLAPSIVHGLNFNELPFLESPGEMAMGATLAYSLRLNQGNFIKLISPTHVDSFLDDIPRSITVSVDKLISTGVLKIDQYHAWVKLSKMQNLIKSRSLNRIRLYTPFEKTEIKKILPRSNPHTVSTWEERNKTLVWALYLESTVMLALFTGMALLVGLCITSGLMIFLNKIKIDLASFWILGGGEKNLIYLAHLFLHTLGLGSVILGLLTALVFLFLLDYYGPNIMPDIFVEQKIPIFIGPKELLLSFFIPYGISTFFASWTLRSFQKDSNYLTAIRSINAL